MSLCSDVVYESGYKEKLYNYKQDHRS